MRVLGEFFLEPLAPYDFTGHLERFWTGGPLPWVYSEGCIRILLPVGSALEPVKACFSGEPWSPAIRVWARGLPSASALGEFVRAGLDWARFLSLLRGYPRLYKIALRYIGLRPGKCLSLYHALVDSIVRQRVPLRLAGRLVSRLVKAYGVRMVVEGEEYYSYPEPGVLAGVSVEELRGLGLSRMKARALVEVAGAEVEGRLPSVGEALRDPQGVIDELTRIYGVGRWTGGLAVAMVHPLFPVWPFGDLAVERGVRLAVGASVEGVAGVLGDYAGLLMYILSLYYEDSRRRRPSSS